MDPIRLRFSKFCDLLVGEGGPKATIRDIIAKGDAPFDPRPSVGRQRTYDGEDLLKWLGFDAMRAAGVRLHHAAKLMRFGYAAERFLDALRANEDVSDFYLFFAQGQADHEKGGFFQLHYKLLRAAEIPAFLAEQGENGPGIEHFVGVPLLPIYTDAQARADLFGMKLIAGDLFKVSEGAADTGEG